LPILVTSITGRGTTPVDSAEDWIWPWFGLVYLAIRLIRKEKQTGIAFRPEPDSGRNPSSMTGEG
jgi:hypothetical protein